MEPIDPTPRRSSWLDRLQAGLEVLLLAGVLSSYLAFLPFSLQVSSADHLLSTPRLLTGFVLLEASITVALLALLLRLHGETGRDIGLDFERWSRHARAGLLVVPALFGANVVVALAVRTFLPEHYVERNPLMESIRTAADLGLFIAAAIVAGGLKEELQRAFILVRFRDHLGGAWVGLTVWSVAFGAGHYVQGLQGALAAGLYGLIFGVLFLARGSLVAPIVAHSVYDTAALLGYWFFGRSA